VGIVGTRVVTDGDRSEESVGISIEEKRALAQARRDGESFNGSQLLTDGYYKGMVTRQKNQTERRRTIIEQMKNIQKTAQETELAKRELPGADDMLMVYHRSMAGKTKVIGNVAVIFDAKGIGRIHRKDMAVYQVLIKQPGYSPYFGEKPEAPKVEEPESIVVEETPPVEEPVEAAPEEEEDWASVDTGELPAVIEEAPELEEEEEAELEKPDFSEFTMSQLKEAFGDLKIGFKVSMSKSELVGVAEEAWEDPEIRSDLYTFLMSEGD